MINELKGLKGFSAWSVYNKIAFNLIFIREFNLDKKTFIEDVARLTSEKDINVIREALPGLVVTSKRVHKTAKECLLLFKAQDKPKRAEMLMEALTHSDLDDDDVLRLLSVHTDKNGIAYGKANITNIDAGQMFNMILETLLSCSYVDTDLSLLTDENKNALGDKRLNVKEEAADIIANNPGLPVDELLSIAIKKGVKGVI